MVIWATAFISIAAILWVVVAKLASNSEATTTSSTQLDEVEVNTDDHMTSTQHAVVTSKFFDLKKVTLKIICISLKVMLCYAITMVEIDYSSRSEINVSKKS